MIKARELFEIIEDYLFAFSSKEDVIREIFDNNISSFTILEREQAEEIIDKKIFEYYKRQFEEEKLPKLVKKYIESKGKAISKKDISFLDNLIIESNYEVTFEDIQKLLEIKELAVYLKDSKKDSTNLVEQIREFQELQELEEDEEEEYSSTEYEGEDIYEKYKNDIKKFELLTPEEERYYIKKVQEENDEEAFNILVGSNQGLCKKVASKYLGRGLSLLDLIQEGNIGLMKAIQRFDLSKNTKLSTYAVWWIRQSIKKAVAVDSRSIHLPLYLVDNQEKISRAQGMFLNENNREPTVEELIKLTGLSEKKVREALKYDIKMASLDKPVKAGDDADSTLGDFLTSDLIETPDEVVDKQADHEAYELLLKMIREDNKIKDSERMEQILRLRFGVELYNEETYRILKKENLPIRDKYTLEEVSKIYGIKRERVRQIQLRGVYYLTNYAAKLRLEIFADGDANEKARKIRKLQEKNKPKSSE